PHRRNALDDRLRRGRRRSGDRSRPAPDRAEGARIGARCSDRVAGFTFRRLRRGWGRGGVLRAKLFTWIATLTALVALGLTGCTSVFGDFQVIKATEGDDGGTGGRGGGGGIDGGPGGDAASDEGGVSDDLIIVKPTKGLMTTESGGTATFTIVLA